MYCTYLIGMWTHQMALQGFNIPPRYELIMLLNFVVHCDEIRAPDTRIFKPVAFLLTFQKFEHSSVHYL